MAARKVNKKESDYKKETHKRLLEKRKLKTKSLWEIVRDKQDNMSTKPTHKRNLKKFLRIKMLVQILVTIAAFSIFYIYATQEHPTNGFMQLIAFYFLYGFVLLISSTFLFRFLSGKGYNFSVVFYQFFYTIAIVIAVFVITYLPMLLILFVSGQISEWIRFAFVTALIVFPISYVISIIFNFMIFF